MSENETVSGLMAVLKEPLLEEEREELVDKFYDEGVPLGVNYDGTLIYYKTASSGYGIQFGSLKSGPITVDAFAEMAAKHGLDFDKETATPYTCTWYNGSDCDLDLLSVEEFREQTA